MAGTPAELNPPKSDSIEQQIDGHEQRPSGGPHTSIWLVLYSNFLIISSNILDIFRLFMRRSQSDSIRQIDSQAWAIWSDSPKVIALNWGNKSFKRKNINWCFCLCSHFDWVWQILSEANQNTNCWGEEQACLIHMQLFQMGFSGGHYYHYHLRWTLSSRETQKKSQ